MSKGRGFMSYLNHFDAGSDKRQASFRSYIDSSNNSSSAEGNHDKQDDIVERSMEVFDVNDTPKLLPGEIIVAKVGNVLKYIPFTNRKKGTSGTLFVTNFKISFMTADRSSYDLNVVAVPPNTQLESGDRRNRNLLLNEHDIPLTSVEKIYQENTKGKKKQLTPGTNGSSHALYLDLYCKDFRIHQFCFQFTKTSKDPNVKVLITALVRHAFPGRPELLFGIEYGKKAKLKEQILDTKLFWEKSDWESELVRQRCIPKWRVTDVNYTESHLSYSVSASLPRYFVVPNCLYDAEYKELGKYFNENRLPTWSYTHSNGASLIRMTYLQSKTSEKCLAGEKKLLDAIHNSCDNVKLPEIFDLEKLCPGISELSQYFVKLKELCMEVTMKDFARTDTTWFSLLDETKWLATVGKCLQVSQDIVECIVSGKSVVIKEKCGRDFSCLISSLVQLLLDPHFRSLNHFQSLVQREWVVMGYKFQTRHGLVCSAEEEQAPVFLLFLDCVWQLLQQFPTSFAFTETYLTTLWDSLTIGLFDTFLHDSPQEKFKLTSTSLKSFYIPSIWNWKLQFSDIDMSFFNNPLFVMKRDVKWNSMVTNSLNLLGNHDGSLPPFRDEMYAKQLGDMYDAPNPEEKLQTTVILYPQSKAPCIKLWSQCYLRWITPAQIIGGGNPSQYLQQCLLVDEILFLQHKIQNLQKNVRSSRDRPRSDLIFSIEGSTHPDLLKNSYLTSSFPFSPPSTTTDHQTAALTTLSMYLENSFLDNDNMNRDSEPDD